MHPALVSAVAAAQRCDQISRSAGLSRARLAHRGRRSGHIRPGRLGSGAAARHAQPGAGLLSAKP